MKPTIFLTLEQILVIHEDMVLRYGGSSGLRDLALLESAVFRPQSTFGGEELYPTIFDKASALMHSILKNHPFVDGNKRTATFSCLAFLEINGFLLNVAQKELVKFALKVENESMRFEEIASWLEKNSQKI